MKAFFTILTSILLIPAVSQGQGVRISTSPGTPPASAMLEVESSTQGFLPPRMTTSTRDQIVSPSAGLMIFNTTTNCVEVYTGSAWKNLCGHDLCTAPPASPSASPATGITDSSFDAQWNTSAGANAYFIDVSGTSDFSSILPAYQNLLVQGGTSQPVTGLAPSTPYFYRVRAANSCGTSAPSGTISVTTSAPIFQIGDTGPGGGIVFHVSNGGLNGLEAAPTDQSAGAEWGCLGLPVSGADGTAIGTGQQNTSDIEAACSTPGTAADLCANLVIGAYSDWYLPSKNEIYQLYLQKTVVGGFANDYYFSSTEANENNAWRQNFFDGGQDTGNKNSLYRVRAIRSF